MEACVVLERAAIVDKIRGALWGTLIADAVSMPVHWYYNPGDISRDFGRITDYHPPKKEHPSSIMPLSNTGGHGRGGQAGRIIGDVINHGKHQYWGVPRMHYHQGMLAGENTLNALCARLVMRTVAANKGQYDSAKFLGDYVKARPDGSSPPTPSAAAVFMTTPASHNDTYAESFHRDFFSNWAAGVPPERCAGAEGHNTPTIGGFVMLPPVILSTIPRGMVVMKKATIEHLRLTHDSDNLAIRAEIYAELLAKVSQGTPLREAVTAAGRRLKVDVPSLYAQMSAADDSNVVGRMFSSACYITDSFPSVLYLAYKYADSFENAVLANTNVGGENCHRGSALGALMGAAVGEKGIPRRLIEGLRDTAAIAKEIDDFVDAVVPP